MDDSWISPFHLVSDFSWPLSLEDKITIFHEQTLGWQLNIADQCLNGVTQPDGILTPGIPHSGYAVLHIVFSYFEMIAKYKDGYVGENASKAYFLKGIFDVFPIAGTYPEIIKTKLENLLYKDVRCGLYHAGTPQSGIILTKNQDEAMLLFRPHRALSVLYIDPNTLTKRLIEHLENYVQALRDPANLTLRQNFEKRFDAIQDSQ